MRVLAILFALAATTLAAPATSESSIKQRQSTPGADWDELGVDSLRKRCSLPGPDDFCIELKQRDEALLNEAVHTSKHSR
jgi:hypothetical protein